MVVRWRTATAQDSRIDFGPAPDQLDFSVSDPSVAIDHVIELTGLQPATRYYYRAGSSTVPYAGGDEDHYFVTSPVARTRAPIRVWAIGDSGTANANAAAVQAAYLDRVASEGGIHTDVWLMLGDNAYSSGTDAQYQAAVFQMYWPLLTNTVLWSTFGNHDAGSASSISLTGPYYDIFTLPDAGQAGGLPTGTEAYYAFDYGNVHFVCLNSQDADRTVGGAMLTWLESDLASTAQDWVIAYWHHPPYSKGSHDSDDPADSGGRMRDMRQDVLPILESYGVDLVLAGHSHSYERSYLLDAHYGLSSTLTSVNLPAGFSDGRSDGDGPYQKSTPGPAPHEGSVYVVAGTSGQTGGGSLDHAAMFVSLSALGSLVLDIEGDRLHARFLDSQGRDRDHFTLVKNTAEPPTADFDLSPASGVAPLTVAFHEAATTNAAAWSWDFDEDGLEDSTAPDPTFSYTTPGTWTVSLTATNAGGEDTRTKPGVICVAAGAPGDVTDLTLTTDGANLAWASPGDIETWDVVRGNLGLLAASGGDFSASGLQCVADSVPVPSLEDSTPPGPGSALFYLVRGEGACALAGSYDGDDPGQSGPRDPAISGAPSACP